MSININVGGMNYHQMSCAQRAEMEKKRICRLTQVREQSKEIAQQVRDKVQCERKNQLRKFQEIKRQELEELKRRQCELIQNEYGHCLSNFGAAHMAACDASCEEDEALNQRREEFDLMAAQRGRAAMLQEQRKRDRDAEERLAKRKRGQAKNVSVQADLETRQVVQENHEEAGEEFEEENDCTRVENFKNKPNLHRRNTAKVYNPQNFTSNSVDSSNSETESSPEVDSEVEFNQISNLLKQKSLNFCPEPKKVEQVVEVSELSDSSESDPPPRQAAQLKKQVKIKIEQAKKSILKKVPAKKIAQPLPKEDERVSYLDFGNKYVTSYVPGGDLITENTEKSGKNAKTAARKQEKRSEKDRRSVSDDVLRQLAEIRAQEALEKEKTRRDYEKLRIQLDELAKEDQEAREASLKVVKNLSARQQQNNEQARKIQMNQAVENAMQRNIITCPPVDPRKKSSFSSSSCEVNVAEPNARCSSKDSNKPSDEINHLVKVERLKDLLERINHQKKLLLKEIEKSEDIPGPDLEKVMECLEKLEKEKAAINVEPEVKKKEVEKLNERERKVEEREKRLEDKIRELFRSQKKEEVVESSEDAVSVPPVEIIIRLKSPRKAKSRKSLRVIDTLAREPKKVYPKTPIKRKSEGVPKKIAQQTQTSPEIKPKTILKKSTESSSIASSKATRNEDSQSISTSYQSLPERINERLPTAGEILRQPHHKLNPVLMHYIQRLLGMSNNIGNQLAVDVSPVNTPGSSTINSSGNNESGTDGQVPSFDRKRLVKLQEFINDNYSFLSEINETLERNQLQEEYEHNINKVDGIWREVLRQKKPKKASECSKKAQKASEKPREVTKKAQEASNKSQESSKPSQGTFKAPHRKVTLKEAPRPGTAAHAQQVLAEPQVQQPRPQTAVKQNIPSQKQQPPPSREKIVPSRQQQQRPQQASCQPPPITNRDMINVTKYLESHMMSNYAEYTANCQKRIADLALMMERVRQEKLKLIENSLSSGEFGHFTEYKEILVQGKSQDALTSSASDLKDSPSQREDQASEEINNILQKQTRPFGVSKDSGISILSRPVTCSDFRDSPDVRVTSEERENTFQPILKDIPKPPKMKITPDNGPTQLVADISQLIKEQEAAAAAKKQRPPMSLNRFSPRLEKPHEPHELSTIAEVETPSASKVNVEETPLGNVESFPNFEDYAKKLLEKTFVDPSLSIPNLNEMMLPDDEPKLKSFLNPRDYGIPEISRHNEESTSSSSSSSIVDILEEMKSRNLLTAEFVSEECNEERHPRQPERKETHIVIKTPEKVVVEITQNAVLTPTKTRSKRAQHKPASPRSNDTLSGIQEIEKEPKDDLDLRGMGLNWGAAMMKRGKANECSSSSSSVEKGSSIQIEIGNNKSSSSERSLSSSSALCQPLNLRDFLTRELMKKSRDEKSTSDESSLSSQFIRSLLNASSGASSSSSRISNNGRVRTSTPIQNSNSNNSNLAAQKSARNSLFPCSSVSTLRSSDRDDSDKSNDKQRKGSN